MTMCPAERATCGAVAAQFEEVLRVARALLDGCQCEKSCYKCLRSYGNQFEHKLLDKRLIAPYLDSLHRREQRTGAGAPGDFRGRNAALLWIEPIPLAAACKLSAKAATCSRYATISTAPKLAQAPRGQSSS